MLKKLCYLLFMFMLSSQSHALSLLEGRWHVMDSLGNVQIDVEIFQSSTGTLSSRVITNHTGIHLCSKCEGALKNKPVKDLTIMTGLMQVAGNPKKYDGGHLLSLRTGHYHTVQAVIRNGNLHITSKDRRINQLWKRIE